MSSAMSFLSFSVMQKCLFVVLARKLYFYVYETFIVMENTFPRINLNFFPEHYQHVSGSIGSSLTAKQQKLFLFPITLCLFLLVVSSRGFVRLHPLFVAVIAVAF